MSTRVIFRKLDDELIALFPELPGDSNPHITCLSYQHVGQHGAACIDLTGQYTTPARPAEYQDLLQELVSIGYDDLIISKRRSGKDLQKRIAACQ